MRYCPNCGIEAESNFCPECGAPMKEKLPRCPKCGTESEGKFCPNCGAPMKEKLPRCPKCGTETDSMFCPNCGAQVNGSANPAQRPAAPEESAQRPAPPAGSRTYQNPNSAAGGTYRKPVPAGAGSEVNQLGWHKFLIYFALWLDGVVDVLSGVLAIRSAIQIIGYGYMRGIGVTFLLLGIATIALGGFLIYIRFQLAGFKREAPKKLLLANISTLAINGGSLLIASFVLNVPGAEFISRVVGTLVFLIICKSYYDKRTDLFIN